MPYRYSLIFVFLFLSLSQNVAAEKVIRILSLDGGGVRGIIEASILKEIEARTNKAISQNFDIIAGSSAGGIIALGLAAPGANGLPLYTADQILEVFTKEGTTIFSSSFCYKIKSLGGLNGPKYEADGIKALASHFLKDFMLSQAIIPTIVTGYDVQGECGIEFSSHSAKKFPGDLDCLMREVAQATSAAPTYFPLAEVNFPWGKLAYVTDGVLYKANPAMLAYLLARKLHPNTPIEIYSIGSGKISARKHFEELKNGGIFQWGPDIAHHFQNSDVEGDHDVLHHILNEDATNRYFRLNVNMGADYDRKMDDISPEHIELLLQKGQEAVKLPIFELMIKRLGT